MKLGLSDSLKASSALFLSASLLTGAGVSAYAQAAQTFSVQESNFKIEGAPATVRAGSPLTFNVTTTGTHNLAIDGNGVDLDPTTPNIVNGTGTVSFRALQPGTYHLYCPVGQHRANGMDVTFTVMAAAATTTTPARLPVTGGASLPLGLASAGIASGIAGLFFRRRSA